MNNAVRYTFVAALIGLGLHLQAASTIQFTVSSYTVAEDAGTVTLTVQRTGDTNTVVSVDYTTLDGTATNGVKYTAVSGTAAFGPGETSQSIVVPILNDGVVGGTKFFWVRLSNPTSGAVLGTLPRCQVFITDNDAGIHVEFAGYWVPEDAGSVLIGVVRGNDVVLPAFTVDYATADGSATNGVDYAGVTNTLSFAAGETVKLLTIPILNDGIKEPDKTFRISLSNPTGGRVLGSPNTATVTIVDNDPGVQFEYYYYWVGEDEGSVLIGVLRGNDGDFPESVEFATVYGTALAGQDYIATNGVLNFAAGETVQFFTVPILNDGLKAPNRTFHVYLTNATAAVLGIPRIATITIIDKDPGVQFEYKRYWVQENEGSITLKVLRGNDVDLPPFTVDYATTNLTAVPGQDYMETNGMLAFAQGETFKMLSVPILCNQSSELDKQFRLTLSNPSAGTVLGTNRTATVVVLDMTGMEAHRLDGVTVLPDRSIQLTLGGGVHKRFKDYFDLYPIEVSTNLADWTPSVTLQRTNSSANILTYTDLAARNSDRGFYCTVTNHLITPLSQPTGPFPVGVISRLVTDPTRRNRYFLSTNGSFMISIWYPAVAEAGIFPGRLEDERLAKDLNWVTAYFNGDPSVIDRLRYLVSYALPGARCTTNEAPYPIVIYSPGRWGQRTEAAGRGPDLASHGYVVVAGDPVDATGTVFPDGTYLQGDSSLGLSDPGFQDRKQDLRFILDELDRWNRADPVFAGRLNVTNVATMGWSWGGGVAAEVARDDERCRAAIILEGYFQNAGSVLASGVQKPSLSIYAQPISIPGQELLLFNKATHDAIWFQIGSTLHENFCDYYWAFAAPVSGREAASAMNAYMLWFLNKYLKESQDPMPALADYPRVINFKQK